MVHPLPIQAHLFKVSSNLCPESKGHLVLGQKERTKQNISEKDCGEEGLSTCIGQESHCLKVISMEWLSITNNGTKKEEKEILS